MAAAAVAAAPTCTRSHVNLLEMFHELLGTALMYNPLRDSQVHVLVRRASHCNPVHTGAIRGNVEEVARQQEAHRGSGDIMRALVSSSMGTPERMIWCTLKLLFFWHVQDSR